jgi:hypothetical protein
MSVLNHSPKILTKGLICCLDSAAIRSYSGSGTKWADLSGKHHDGSLENSPTFVNVNDQTYSNHIFSLDGSNDYIKLEYNALWQNLQTITYDLWFQTAASSTRQGLISSHESAVGSNNDAIEIEIESDGTSFVGFRSTNGTFYAAHHNSTLSLNTWYNIVAVLDSNTVYYYLNSDLKGTNTSFPDGGTVANSASATLLLGRYATTYLNGKIASFKAYNRALTSSEIIDNYKQLKGRFSL